VLPPAVVDDLLWFSPLLGCWGPSCLAGLHSQLGGAFEGVLCIHFCVCDVCIFDVGYGTRSVVYDDLYLHDSCHGMWHRVPHRVKVVFM
jgi:hypothetical protein